MKVLWLELVIPTEIQHTFVLTISQGDRRPDHILGQRRVPLHIGSKYWAGGLTQAVILWRFGSGRAIRAQVGFRMEGKGLDYRVVQRLSLCKHIWRVLQGDRQVI